MNENLKKKTLNVEQMDLNCSVQRILLLSLDHSDVNKGGKWSSFEDVNYRTIHPIAHQYRDPTFTEYYLQNFI